MSVGKIQRTPLGVLQFLGLVGSGQAPVDLADEVRGQIDMLPFYGASSFRSNSQNGSLQNIGDSIVLSVPDRVAWLLLAAQVIMVVGAAGEQGRFSIGIQPPAPVGGGMRVHTMPSIQTAVGANARIVDGFCFPRPILLAAGSSLTCVVEDINVAAARAATLTGLVYQFQI